MHFHIFSTKNKNKNTEFIFIMLEQFLTKLLIFNWDRFDD